MRHLGDITKINGAFVEPVDCVIGGSPCQDLSIAGNRAGLAGARSGLYMEQIRIIKEMRTEDERRGRTNELIRPRYMVWENVPGAFSSNKGKDFAAVIEEAIRIVEPQAPCIEVPERGWPTWGGYRDVGGRWSLAWRVLDAQYWGVPQRRRRIALVVDFGGDTAHEILFERKSLFGNPAPGGTAGERTAARAEKSPSYAVRIRGGCDGGGKGALVQEDKSGTLGTSNDQTVFCLQANCVDRADTAGCNGKGWKDGTSYTLTATDRHCVCAGFKPGNSEQARSIGFAEEQSPTLNASGNSAAILDMTHACDVIRDCGDIVPSLQARMGTGGNQVPLVSYGIGNGQVNEAANPSLDRAKPLDAMHDAQAVFCPDVSHALKAKANCDFLEDSETYVCSAAVDCRNGTENQDTNGTLQAKSNGGQSVNLQNVVRTAMQVRRLTPLECTRLQGFPDGWVDIGEWVDDAGKTHKESDTPKYKALGNSIALPQWKWVLKRICANYGRDATMASLFDGIGGFTLIWTQLNGRNSVRWVSEIEPFPIAVTRRHFGDEDKEIVGDYQKYL